MFKDTTTGTNITVIVAGGTVTWIWDDAFCHSVTSLPGSSQQFSTDGSGDGQSTGIQDAFMVEAVGTSNSFNVTFPAGGVFPYRCVHHESVGMRGIVIVIGP